MSKKKISFSDQAREAVLRGIRQTASIVGETMGPKGRLVFMARSFGGPRMTKDGATVAKEVALPNPEEDLGAQYLKSVASKTADIAGDGTTTATILADAIVHEGVRHVVAGVNPMDLKRGIDMSTEALLTWLGENTLDIKKSPERVRQVATISANSDPEFGEMIAEAMDKVGEEGVITVEEAKSINTDCHVVEGMQFDRGYVSPFFVNVPDKSVCEFTDPYILIWEKKIDSFKPLIPLLEKTYAAGKPLVIIADNVEGEALNGLVANRLNPQAPLKIAAVKAPFFGDNRKAGLGDIAAVTGGHAFLEGMDTKLENVTLEMLGRAKRILIKRDETLIVQDPSAALQGAIRARCGQIRAQIAEETSDYNREKLQERLARLTGGVAVIRVGGVSETEVKERKDRIEDAINATKAAMQEGIVPGGGSALIHAAKEALDKLKPLNDDQRLGIEIVKRAVQAPVKQIARNAGKDGSVIVEKILSHNDKNYGYDAQSGQFGDMLQKGIIDPKKVVRCALQNAASMAGNILTMGGLITDIPEKTTSTPSGGMGMGGMEGMDF